MTALNMPMRAISPGGTKRPYLNVIYINPHTNLKHKAIALIDTGADCCVVPRFYAEILGHHYDKGNPKAILGVNGQANCYSHTMQIQIPNFCTDEIQVIFSENIKEPILGVRTFLMHFCLTVDYPNNTFSLRKPENPIESMTNWTVP